MPIEIRELLIRVRVDDQAISKAEAMDLEKIRKDILKDCNREIKKHINKRLER